MPRSHTFHYANSSTAHRRRVLIVENDFLIAEMVYDMVRDLGYEVIKPAHNLPTALKEIAKDDFDCALVNIGIDAEKHGMEIADILKQLGVPFGFVTGYSHSLEDRHADVPLLLKPFNSAQLQAFLRALV